jgi:LCP family protein required for cell wall assembly
MEHPASHPRAGHPPGRRLVFLAIAGLASLLVAAGSALSIATIRHVEANIIHISTGPGCERTDPDCLPSIERTGCDQDLCNYLILGSDSRKGVPNATKHVSGQRSDTIMVVTVDTRIKRTTVLSIPRDLQIDIPGYGESKINTAINHPQGQNLMVKTVEKLTGLSINHYVEVNFLGFQGLVNALGGVPVCINRPMVDSLAKLNLPHAGCYNLKGPQALAFVRARHIEGDTIPDFSRISRQQQFIRALISKGLSAGALFKLPSLIKAVQANLVTDKSLNLYELQDLTKNLADNGQRGVTFRIVPSVPVQKGTVDYLQLDQYQAPELFKRIRNGDRLGDLGLHALLTPISPANVSVQVLDAGSGGAAQQVVDFLQSAGFSVRALKTAPSDITKSEILWRHESKDFKEVVSSYLTLFPIRLDKHNTSGATVVVVVGSDFPGLEGVPGSS